jgi:hypothetical protein
MDDETLNRELDEAWGRILRAAPSDPQSPDFTGWSYRLTPPLPEAWPPDGLPTLLAYAYPCGFSPQLRDAERVGAPWARVEREKDSWLRWTLLCEEIREMGIQGVWPLRAEELAVLQGSSSAPAALGAMTQIHQDGGPIADLVRAFYGHWLRCNGVIARHLQEQHRDFFDWVQSGGGGSPS